MDLFGRATWLMLAAGAIPTALAGWWIGSRAAQVSPAAAALLAALSVGLSLLAAFLAWRWFAAPLRELERGLARWTAGDLSKPLDEAKMAGWRRLARQFAAAQDDLRRALEEAQAGLALERARLGTIVERIPDAIVMTNLRGEVLFMNAAALPLLGMTPADASAAGRGLLTPLDTAPWRLKVQDYLKAHTTGGLVELKRPGEEPSFYRTSVAMFNDAESGDFGVLLMLRDQTAERRLDAMKEEFFQAAAHDLRAPLFALQGYLRLLRKSFVPDERQAGWLEAIDQSCERLTGLVKDALDAARIESGHLRPREGDADPRALLQRAARLFQPLADERGVALEVRAAASAPAAFEGDERLLERVVNNLVANAIRFTPRGGLVTLETAASGPDRVELSVSDTGPGVPEDQRAAVFEKFKQLDHSGQPKTGFGLGLAICAKIVKLHGGEIWVQRGKAGGAQFVVLLPLKRRKEAVPK